MSASTTEGRTFTEGEAYALVSDNVARETAALNEKITDLETAKADLETKVDTLETEKAQAVQRAEAAEQALTDYKNEIEAEKAREQLREERKAKLAEANSYLEITKEREDRIVAMSDEDFEAYITDMRELASKAPQTPKSGDVPHESAAFQGENPPAKKASVAHLHRAGQDLINSAHQKGA